MQNSNFKSRQQQTPNSNNKDQQQFMKLMGSTANIGQTQQRTLSLKQLKEVIEEIYLSKIKSDQKQFENKLPRETMEQHMYSYLNQKYGLKNLIIEWATAIINGISVYAREDNDVAVFGKILRNECDEEFRFVQQQVKNTIKELLKMYLKGKYPYKHSYDINQKIQEKQKGFLNEDECKDIIKYMYNQNDSEHILEKVSAQLRTLTENIDIRKLPREEQMALIKVDSESQKQIKYQQFEKIILDFQLRSHHNFLKNFLDIFKKIDQDQNGLIDENEFIQMLKILDLEDYERKFLEKIDPYNNKIITFSQCITLFSSEVLTDNNEQLSILQKISQMNLM